MRNYDFSPLYRQFVGFDRMADLIDSAARSATTITARKEVAANEGRGEDAAGEDEARYLHRGIARRSFIRRFQLADHVRVQGAELTHGLLTISLKRELPEALKPRKIALSQGPVLKADQKVIAGKPNRKGKAA